MPVQAPVVIDRGRNQAMSTTEQRRQADAGHGLILAGAVGLLAVLAGAFGAHVLRGMLSPRLYDVYQTGATYQMYHALALLGVACAQAAGQDSVWLRRSQWFFVLGICLFSGSLYALALSGWKWLGAITPLGGISLVVGWGCLAWTGRDLLLRDPGQDEPDNS